jgi:2-dehydro-3-deoxyphosphogluconate aldolase / (4S)-4-hydroxy-2-oxoglutarate aldolase
MKNDIINKLEQSKIVAVIRADTEDDAYLITNACVKGGIRFIEITFTIPNASKIIKKLCDTFINQEIIIGAGTVLDNKTAKIAIESGAKFIVSPTFDIKTSKICKKEQIPYIPGCLTITEIMNAINHGCDVIKLFPGSAFGPSYIKSIHGPLPNIKIMPTGGISLSNISDWVKNGAFALGVGSELTSPAKNKDYEKITKNAIDFIEAVNKKNESKLII